MHVVPPHRTTRSFTQRLPAPPERVFPLLCPVREAEWVPGWDPRLVVTESGVAEEDCVFVTGPPEREAVWVVTEYEPPSRIGFVKVTPGETAVRIRIELAPAEGGDTEAEITYRYTALGEAGAREVDGFTEASWERFMRAWEDDLSHFLRTGARRPWGGARG